MTEDAVVLDRLMPNGLGHLERSLVIVKRFRLHLGLTLPGWRIVGQILRFLFRQEWIDLEPLLLRMLDGFARWRRRIG